MQECTALVKNILTSQVNELLNKSPYSEVLHVTHLVFLRLERFNPGPSSLHRLQEFGILFLTLLQGSFLRLNFTLSFFKLLRDEEGREEGREGRRERREGRKEREREGGRDHQTQCQR